MGGRWREDWWKYGGDAAAGVEVGSDEEALARDSEAPTRVEIEIDVLLGKK